MRAVFAKQSPIFTQLLANFAMRLLWRKCAAKDLRVKDINTGVMWTSNRFALNMTVDNSRLSQTVLINNSYFGGLVRLIENRVRLGDER